MITIIQEIKTSNVFDNNKCESDSDDDLNLIKMDINTPLLGEYIILQVVF